MPSCICTGSRHIAPCDLRRNFSRWRRAVSWRWVLLDPSGPRFDPARSGWIRLRQIFGKLGSFGAAGNPLYLLVMPAESVCGPVMGGGVWHAARTCLRGSVDRCAARMPVCPCPLAASLPRGDRSYQRFPVWGNPARCGSLRCTQPPRLCPTIGGDHS